MSCKWCLILKCQIASSQIKVIFSCDYALFPPVSSREKKKKNNQKNTLIGGRNWCETFVFFVFDFQMSAGERSLSVCHTGCFSGEETEGVVAGVGWNWNDALFPLTAAPATVIKSLIVASWEFTLNISSSVIIIWVWVGRGCNHLGLLFDETLGSVVPLYSHYFCVNSFS